MHQDCISPKCCSWRHIPRALPASHSPAPGQLCLGMFSSVPWESAVEGLAVHEGWSVLKNHRLKAEEQAIPWCPKSSKRGRRPAWLNREFLLELGRKKRLDDLWKQGQALQEDYRAVVGIRREKTRKAKAQVELKLVSVVPDNKKGFS